MRFVTRYLKIEFSSARKGILCGTRGDWLGNCTGSINTLLCFKFQGLKPLRSFVRRCESQTRTCERANVRTTEKWLRHPDLAMEALHGIAMTLMLITGTKVRNVRKPNAAWGSNQLFFGFSAPQRQPPLLAFTLSRYSIYLLTSPSLLFLSNYDNKRRI